jgi:hypothetical protein
MTFLRLQDGGFVEDIEVLDLEPQPVVGIVGVVRLVRHAGKAVPMAASLTARGG